MLSKAMLSEFSLCGTPYVLKPPFLGKGRYGICCTGYDNKRKRFVAVKKISMSSLNEMEVNRTLREIRLMRKVLHRNIICLNDMFSNKSDLYLILDKMDSDVLKVIKSKQTLSQKHIQYILYQCLQALRYLHSASIIHRDIKPENILVDKVCRVKLCDFGLATYYENEGIYTKYVVTRWYRAPELLMKADKYNEKIDIWSIGCVFAELVLGTPLFKGKHYLEMVNSIVSVLGIPNHEDLVNNASKDAYRYVSSLPKDKFKKKKIESFVMSDKAWVKIDQNGLDLLKRMLVFNPKKRISVKDALNHKFFDQLNSESPYYLKESWPIPEVKKSLSSVNTVYKENDLRDELCKEILFYHPKLCEQKLRLLYGNDPTKIRTLTQQIWNEIVDTMKCKEKQRKFNQGILQKKDGKDMEEDDELLDDDTEFFDDEDEQFDQQFGEHVFQKPKKIKKEKKMVEKEEDAKFLFPKPKRRPFRSFSCDSGKESFSFSRSGSGGIYAQSFFNRRNPQNGGMRRNSVANNNLLSSTNAINRKVYMVEKKETSVEDDDHDFLEEDEDLLDESEDEEEIEEEIDEEEIE